MTSRMGGSILLRHLGGRLFSTTTTAVRSAATAEVANYFMYGGSAPAKGMAMWVRVFPVRMASTTASPAVSREDKATAAKDATGKDGAGTPPSAKKEIVSYWGIQPSKLVKEDGTEWKWSCFRPWDTYNSDVSIDLKKHHVPTTFLDKVAYWTVKALRIPVDIFFQRRHGHRVMMIETVAAVPGMVGGMLLHLRSLRRFDHSGGWIRALLEEAENERMHLMTFMEVVKPRWYERALVIAVQGVFFNAYFVGYLLSPKFAHRVVGYLEEEAIHSYNEFFKDLEAGKMENIPAPAIAIDYWRLPADATLKDVVTVVRADEAHHRDVNHFASDIHYRGMELKETPAPLEYH
ncbi:ubiquinol oxidase 1a, mitochondrial-like [Typha latifolia]|uniref:ubiquinol oxidase 1a, mitochondrial-like n=1 Tax=Typha latifolia TaxID=4733 RepID=UPI003C2F7DDD